MQLTLKETPDFILRGELLWFGLILHGDVSRWGRGTLRDLRRSIREVARISPWPVWAFQAYSHDPKKRKFIQMVGGVFHHYRITGEGEWAEMYLFPPLD